MDPDVFLRTPCAIDECIRREFPDATVQIDGEHEVLNIVLPQALDLPGGARVTISTAVVKQILIDVINEIAEYRLTSQEASQDVVTGTPLSGWDEARTVQSQRLQQRHCEQQHGSSPEDTLWSIGVRYITQTLAPLGRAIVHVSSIGGLYPPNAQTALVALNAITAVAACVGRMLSGPALGLSLLLRLTNIVVLAGRCHNPSFEAVRRLAPLDLAIYLLAIPLLIIPGPYGVIASGVLASIPEVVAWIGKYRDDNDPYAMTIFRGLMRNPDDLRVARSVFYVPEGEDPDQTSVDKRYDYCYERCIKVIRLAPEREYPAWVVELKRAELAFLSRAYITLMGHPRSTGVD